MTTEGTPMQPPLVRPLKVVAQVTLIVEQDGVLSEVTTQSLTIPAHTFAEYATTMLDDVTRQVAEQVAEGAA